MFAICVNLDMSRCPGGRSRWEYLGPSHELHLAAWRCYALYITPAYQDKQPSPVLATSHIRSKKDGFGLLSYVFRVTFLERMCEVASTASIEAAEAASLRARELRDAPQAGAATRLKNVLKGGTSLIHQLCGRPDLGNNYVQYCLQKNLAPIEQNRIR